MIIKKLLFAFVVFSSGSSFSQEVDTSDINSYYLDLSIPDITAFSLLNVEPNEISRPGSVKEFVVGTGGYVSANGSFTPGLALEWAPLKTCLRDKKHWANSFEWKNLLVSLATKEDSLGGHLGYAFRWAPIDKTDPLRSEHGRKGTTVIIETFRKGLKEDTKLLRDQFESMLYEKVHDEELINLINVSQESTKNMILAEMDSLCCSGNEEVYMFLKKRVLRFVSEKEGLNVVIDELEELLQIGARYLTLDSRDEQYTKSMFNDKIVKFKEEFKKRHWNKLAFEIGGGHALVSEESNLFTLGNNYFSGYASLAFPLSRNNRTKFQQLLRDNSQVIIQIKGEQFNMPDSLQNNSFFIGSRLIFGKYNSRFSLEAGYTSLINSLSGVNSAMLKYTIGGEFRISEGNWLELAVSGYEELNSSSRSLGLIPKISFRHAFNKEARF